MKRKTKTSKPQKKSKSIIIIIILLLTAGFLIGQNHKKAAQYISVFISKTHSFFNSENKVLPDTSEKDYREKDKTAQESSNFDQLFKNARNSSILRKTSNIKNLESKNDEINVLLFLCYQKIYSRGAARTGENILRLKKRQLYSELKTLAKKGFRTVTLSQWHNHIFDKKDFSSKYALLCFEGSYIEHYTIVLPILKSLGQRATFFISPDSLNTGKHKKMSPAMIKKLSDEKMEIGISFKKFSGPSIGDNLNSVFSKFKGRTENLLKHKINFALTFPGNSSSMLKIQEIIKKHYLGEISLGAAKNVNNQKMVKTVILSDN
jgi:hypothetical protein